MPEACKTCKFAFPSDEKHEVVCRRFPAQLIYNVGTAQIINRFPIMLADKGWCGEYRPKLEIAK